MIYFSQNIISIDSKHARICWIVENHTKDIISEAVAFSDLYSHRFGSIGIDSIKTITFEIPLSKTCLLGTAVMNYSANNEVRMVESNILKYIN
ncbi:MAG: hypothetical protein IJ287_10605 [Methanobrevibacter sp.]|nr:hypothetical protein [Methanobrevibacter sp.]